MRVRLVVLIGAAIALTSSAIAAQDPSTAQNNSWISLKGTVTSAGPSSFKLDYGSGLIRVEMDDWNWYAASHPILEGDRVTVYGRVDDDLYETASIEASSVYVRNLNTYFYADDVDEEDVVFHPDSASLDNDLQLRGTVADIDGREFTLDTGTKEVKVDTLKMPYNPLDDEGYQKLKEGDFVQVTGNLDVDFFERTEIAADTVTTLFKDTTKRSRP